MTPLDHARNVLRGPGERTDNAIIAAAELVMTYGTPCEFYQARDLHRAAVHRARIADQEAWLIDAVTAARPIGEVTLPAFDTRGTIRAELPRFAALAGFAVAVLVVVYVGGPA